jgi:hypothetical protein
MSKSRLPMSTAMWQSGENEFGLAAIVAALRERATDGEQNLADAAPERETPESRAQDAPRAAART